MSSSSLELSSLVIFVHSKIKYQVISFFVALEPDKLDPADEMSWQHYLYSKLGKKDDQMIEESSEKSSTEKKGEEKRIEDTVERIVAMAKVLFGLHMVRKLRKKQKKNSILILEKVVLKFFMTIFTLHKI